MAIEIQAEKLPPIKDVGPPRGAELPGEPPPPRVFVGILRRLWAFVLDCMLLYLLSRGLDRFARPALLQLNPALPWLGFAGIFTYFWLANGPVGRGRTVGKVIMHLCVADKAGQPLGAGAALKRALLQQPALLVFLGLNPAYATLIFPLEMRYHATLTLLLMMLMCLAWAIALIVSAAMHPYKQAWHDEWAHSHVTWAPPGNAFLEMAAAEPDALTQARLGKHRLITVGFWALASIALLIYPLKALTLPEVKKHAELIAGQQRAMAPTPYVLTQTFTANAEARKYVLEDVARNRAEQMRRKAEQEAGRGGEPEVVETTATLLARAELDGETNLGLEMKPRGAVTEDEVQGAEFKAHAEKLRRILWAQMEQDNRTSPTQAVVARRFTLLLYEPFQVFFNNGTLLRARASGPADPAGGALAYRFFDTAEAAQGDGSTTATTTRAGGRAAAQGTERDGAAAVHGTTGTLQDNSTGTGTLGSGMR